MTFKAKIQKPEWLPDWKDVAKYPDPKKADGRIWAWEFLRRNPQYQQLWERLAKLPGPDGSVYKTSGWERIEIAARFENDFGVWKPASPSMTSSDPEFEWRPQFTARKPRYWIMPWPDDDGIGIDMDGANLEHPAEVLVKFDLRLQLTPQLNSTKAILKTEAKRLAKAGALGGEPRSRFEKYQRYLRVLDAKLSGASPKAIAKEILSVTNKATLEDTQYAKEKVDDIFEPAKRLRDGGYRFLAALRGK